MKRIVLIFGFVLVSTLGFSQSYLSLYNFDHVNQNLMVNPSSPHNYRFVIGIPGLAGNSIHFNSSSNISSIFETGSNANEQFEELLNSLTGKERINLNQSTDVLFVGFGTKNGYFSLGAQEVLDFNMIFPGELMRFLYYGNAGSDYFGKTLDLSNFDASVTSRINYHIGYQHYIDSNLIVGGRYKYISGATNINTARFNTTLYSDVDVIQLNTDILFQTSGINSLSDFNTNDVTEYVNARNSGMAFDLGVTYIFNDKFNFSGSIVDFGWINWRRDTWGYSSNGEFEFDGLEYEYIPNQEDDLGDRLEYLVDSIENKLNFQEGAIDSYRTTLPTHFMGSVQYNLNKAHSFGFVYQGTIWNSRMYHSYGVQYIGRWHKLINFMAGYSVIDNIQNNLSLGLSLRLGAFQIYALTDNVFGVLEPQSISATNIRFGINLSFYDKPKVLKEDK